ncbi:MAG: hypothetical protein U0670_05790 [Anaerolineae bacterium]
MIKPLRIVGARIYTGRESDCTALNTTDRVLVEPHPRALTVDLEGYTIFPGLINGHDHLDRNHYPRTKFREKYDNAHQWGEDISARLNESPFKELRAYPLEDKCLIGGLKNLLCGALTVYHHDPPHAPLFKSDFPVRVVQNYGWAHSLHFTPEAEIIASYRRTSPNVPWFIHLAEGTDYVAAGEYQRLKAMGCVGANTVIVHGVGLTEADIVDAAPKVLGLVWCPTSNDYLLGTQPKLGAWLASGGRLVLGSDSRLTAECDFQFEQLQAKRLLIDAGWPDYLFDTAGLMRDSLAETLSPGSRADWFISQGGVARADLALIVRGGVPQIGDPDLMEKFPHIEAVDATLDGKPKRVNLQLARQIQRCSLKEPGLEIIGSIKSSRWF